MHLYCYDFINIFDNIGSKGNYAIFLPKYVSLPYLFNAPKAYNIYNPFTNMS